MWQLKEIKASNLASFEELAFGPEQGVTTLIFGHNLDNQDNSPSNGSGKSMLIEAISLSITGEPLRKIKADELISDAASEMCVCAKFFNTETKTVFEIERGFSRTSPQAVACRMNGENQPCSSVLEYNKHILDVIGLTKDEIYSNFILTQDHYASFFSASDRDKKAIINKFSNADMVDVAIEAVKKDQIPATEKKEEARLAVEQISGAIEILKQQIDDYDNSKEERQQRIEQQKQKCLDSIAAKRGEIREQKADKLAFTNTKKELEDNLACVQEMKDDKNIPLAQAYLKLKQLNLTEKDWALEADRINEQISEKEREIDKTCQLIKQLKADLDVANSEYRKVQTELAEANDAFSEATKKYEVESQKISTMATELENKNEALHLILVKTEREIKRCKISIEGAIKCPKCSHEFVLSDFRSVDEINDEIRQHTELYSKTLVASKQNETAMTRQKLELTELRKWYNEQSSGVDAFENKLRTCRSNYENLKSKQHTLELEADTKESSVKSLHNRLDSLKYDMLDDIEGTLKSKIASAERNIRIIDEGIAGDEGMIETYQSQYNALMENKTDERERLQSQLDSKSEEMVEAQARLNDATEKLNVLVEQENRFVRFKTKLANSKIAALSQRINGILQDIGSDLRIRIEGYIQLKSGKIRDKMTVDIIKDGSSFGSYFKLSKGERTRIDVACIIAMIQLMNSNCTDGRGLDLLIMDEILGNVDEKGLSDIYSALNTLQVTTLVVSHNPVSAAYRHKLTICKQNGISKIE